MLFSVVYCNDSSGITGVILACLVVFVARVKAKKKDSQRHCWLSIVAPTFTVEGERQGLL